MCFSNKYLFGKGVYRCCEAIAFTIDGRVCTAPNCVHFPVSVVIVYQMEVSMPALAFIRWYSFLDETTTTPEMEGKGGFIYLGILCTRPSPKWLNAIVTCMLTSEV